MGSGTALIIVKLLEVLSLGLTLAPQIRSQFDRDMTLLKQMVAEGRDPTDDEMAALDKDIADLRDILHRPI